MKEYSMKEAAAILGHKGGAHGLSLDAQWAPDFPVRLWKERGRWHGLNDITIGALKAYYDSKKVG